MSITIKLPPDQERQLAERAARSGRNPAGYVRLLIERDLHAPVPAPSDEAMAPFRRQVEQSGLSDDELDAFFEDVRDEVWREKAARPGGDR
ncbi:hypothetical protein BH23PLA1_BH23PLA1_38870 [soil metagenome]